MNIIDISRGDSENFIGRKDAAHLYVMSGRIDRANDDTVYCVRADCPGEAVDAFVCQLFVDNGCDDSDIPERGEDGDYPEDSGFQLVATFCVGAFKE